MVTSFFMIKLFFICLWPNKVFFNSIFLAIMAKSTIILIVYLVKYTILIKVTIC